MSNDGEQRQVKQVSATAPGARGGALLPSAPGSGHRERSRRRPTAAALRRLRESARWRELDARAPARAAAVRSTALSESDYDAELESKVAVLDALEPRA